MAPIKPVAIEANAYRVPIATPVATSFGIMRDRPAVVVRAVDESGAEGFGEVWCNWPTVGAEHRARLVNEVVGPRLVGRSFASPAVAFADVSRALEVLVLQTAEVGPIAQAIAGLDIALWDLSARKAGLPLYRAMAEDTALIVAHIPAYASGISPEQPERLAAERQAEGHHAFKLKIGFKRELDLRNIEALRKTLRPAARILVDANQAYDVATAKAMARDMAPFDVDWYEEPIRADQPLSAWRDLKAASPVRLAAGENLRGAELEQVIDAGILGVVQPDVAKWGGISGTLPVARKAIAAGQTYCPHWLAGGIGLIASAHLLAAAGGDGLLEIDANPNPLRDLLGGSLLAVRDGTVPVPQAPGLGFTPDLAGLARYRTWPRV